MQQVNVKKAGGKVIIIVGDPDSRGEAWEPQKQVLKVSEAEAALLLMKLKGVFQ